MYNMLYFDRYKYDKIVFEKVAKKFPDCIKNKVKQFFLKRGFRKK